MITLFDILPLLGAGVGLIVGVVGGDRLLGMPGVISGALFGGALGFIAGHIPFVVALRMLSRELAAQPVTELRTSLRSADCPAPNVILLELQRRGEDIRSELPVVLEMLVSEDSGRRGAGWAALVSAFPELAALIPDYRIFDPDETCRSKIERLRAQVEPSAAPDRGEARGS